MTLDFCKFKRTENMKRIYCFIFGHSLYYETPVYRDISNEDRYYKWNECVMCGVVKKI